MTVKSDIVNKMHFDFKVEMSAKVIPNKATYTPTFQNYITTLMALANVGVETDAEAVSNAKAMLAVYQKIVTYCAGKTNLSTGLRNLLSAVQMIKSRTTGTVV